MADTKSSVVMFSGSHEYAEMFNFEHVDTGEATPVQKIDISGLQGAPTTVRIMKIDYSVSNGMSVGILFDHTTDDLVLNLTGSGNMDFRNTNGLPDPASTGGTGDIMFSTVGHAAGDTYSIAVTLGFVPA